MRWLACALILACAACDPAYSLHLHAQVTREGKPLPGARILSLVGGQEVARTDAQGLADTTITARLQSPAAEPLALALSASELMVLLPGRDFETHARGLFFVTEWDAQVQVAWVGARPAVQARCTGTSCAIAPPRTDCAWHELAISDSQAQVHFVADEGTRGDAAHREVTFRRLYTGPGVVLGICPEGEGAAVLVSGDLTSPP